MGGDGSWQASDWATLIAALASATVAIFSKQMVNAIVGGYLRISEARRKNRIENDRLRALDEERNDTGHKRIIKYLDKQMTELRDEIRRINDEHDNCRAQCANLQAECNSLRVENTRMEARIAHLESKKS